MCGTFEMVQTFFRSWEVLDMMDEIQKRLLVAMDAGELSCDEYQTIHDSMGKVMGLLMNVLNNRK